MVFVSPLRAGFDLAGAFPGLVLAITVAVSSCVLCCVWRTLFPCPHLRPLAHSLSVFSSAGLPEPQGRGCDVDVKFRAKHSIVSSLHLDQLWLSVLMPSTAKRGVSDED